MIPGVQLREMQRNRSFGMCCGAGGGRMWMEEEPTQRVNIRRVEQALETNPDAVAVACPFCMTMIDDGLKAKGMEEKVPALDVMEIVAERDEVVSGAPQRALDVTRGSGDDRRCPLCVSRAVWPTAQCFSFSTSSFISGTALKRSATRP